jgi:hypothetical protein
MELYVRTGASVPVGGPLGDALNTGLFIQGGGRTLLFDARETAAWTIDLGIDHVINRVSAPGPVFTFSTHHLPVNLHRLQRTALSPSLGGEFYLHGSARSAEWRWRVGLDGGLRWGTTRLEVLDTIPNNPNDASPSGFHRLNSWDWGPMVALHSDVEFPCGCCTYFAGFRFEWEDTFNNRLQLFGVKHDIKDVNLLLNLGVRF